MTRRRYESDTMMFVTAPCQPVPGVDCRVVRTLYLSL
jgi:hypothetical protein